MALVSPVSRCDYFFLIQAIKKVICRLVRIKTKIHICLTQVNRAHSEVIIF